MTKYSDLLRDPRWQKMRLEILQRDDFTCQQCRETTKTLHVHHCYYERGRAPWDYDPKSLLTLCLDCHEAETVNYPGNKQYHPFLRDLASIGLTGSDLEGLSYAFYCGQRAGWSGGRDIKNIIAELVINQHFYDFCLDFIRQSRFDEAAE